MSRSYLEEQNFRFTAWHSHAKVTLEDLDSSGTKWVFDNAPVSMQDLQIWGVPSGASETGTILSFTVQPLSGVLEVEGTYTSVTASYRYYQSTTQVVPGGDGKWDETYNPPPLNRTIAGQPKYYLTKAYPERLDVNITLPNETVKNFVAGPVYNAAFFLVIDIGHTNKAWEGPIISPEVHSICKGDQDWLPVTMYVSSYGVYNATGNESGTGPEIAWKMF